MSFNNFNDTVNDFLDPIFANPAILSTVKLFLVLYGALAAPKLPLMFGPYFANSYFRMAFMAFIIWIANKDPALAVVIAVGYALSMNYFVQNGLQQVSQTGVVSPDVAIVISGGGGPSIKPQSVIQAEAHLMQASVNNAKATGYVTPPEAVLTSGPPSTSSNAGIPVIPAGQPATNPSMMAVNPEGGVPHAFTPDSVHDLAVAPGGT
jgi:hypothetical protein